MIRFLNDETVAGHRFGKGAIARFDSATEAQLIAVADAENYPLISRPIEILSGSAVATSCALTAIDEVLASFTIAAGILGVNSVLQIEPLWTFASSANNKVLKIKIGGMTVYSATRTTSVKEAPLFVLANRNSLASQIHPYDNNYVVGGLDTPVTSAINFANAQTVEITGLRTNSGDTLTLEYYRILHFIGD
ncbi:hypothetical protein SAMN05216428_10559 [Nitrosospira sp. Nsp11]|uniref:hypothetical protein n=1 Tax=unclassified Nitrosospira TaxID=2609267 RepID=UPI0008885236|nr:MULTISPECIES: hypothetical protein [unclassified Nitrosospira]SDA12649.1 hypothetical protein SAMN05216315_103139 [Nitrosospira sp. Nsp18]SHL70204.1 hypothetical protein SAMN05216428_10559 [Nitrosospira sp. Nsp11]